MSDAEGPGSPEELRERIQKLRAGPDGTADRRSLAHALAFFLSMGVTMVGAIYGGFLLGTYLDPRTGSSFYLPIILLLSVGAGAMMVYQMLKPLLK